MKKLIIYIIILTTTMLLGTGCGSTGFLTGSEKPLEAKVKMKVASGSHTVASSGTIRIKPGKIIRISLTPLFGVEAARIEFTPHNALVIDRMHKRYAQMTFRQMKKYIRGASFKTMRDMFTPETKNGKLQPGNYLIKTRSGRDIKVEINYRGATHKDKLKHPTTIPEGYREVDAEKILKKFEK